MMRTRHKIGYIPIDNYKTSKRKVCEAPRHAGLGLAAYAVVAVMDGRGNEIVERVCEDCCWNLMEEK